MDEETKQGSGCFEMYKLTEANGKTSFTPEVDAVEKYIIHINTTYPLTLQEFQKIN